MVTMEWMRLGPDLYIGSVKFYPVMVEHYIYSL